MHLPAELLYTKEHEWIRIDDSGNTATIGITDFAQTELGDIVYVEIETLSQTLDRNDIFGTVEAVKTVSDLYLPVSGRIMEVNDKLEEKPELVNEDPYGHGWMIKIEITGSTTDADLMTSGEYGKMVGQ
ncbi:MAG: glycine cleavage system protein GcvH [Bacteroidota bacterium]